MAPHSCVFPGFSIQTFAWEATIRDAVGSLPAAVSIHASARMLAVCKTERIRQGRWGYGKMPMQTFIDIAHIARGKAFQTCAPDIT